MWRDAGSELVDLLYGAGSFAASGVGFITIRVAFQNQRSASLAKPDILNKTCMSEKNDGYCEWPTEKQKPVRFSTVHSHEHTKRCVFLL